MRTPAAIRLALGALILASVCASAAASGLDEVMGQLALRRHGKVEFVEQQFLGALKRPLESFGEMTYQAPDRLEKHTLRPREESLLLEGGTLTVQRGHSRHVLALRSYPQALPFIESIRATLAGDRPALERVFRVKFSGDVGEWSLTLEPLDASVAKSVAQVQIDGARDQLRRVEIRQPDGDRSLMTLRPAPGS